MGTGIIRVTRDYWITFDLHRSVNQDREINGERVRSFLFSFLLFFFLIETKRSIQASIARFSRTRYKRGRKWGKIWKISLPLFKRIKRRCSMFVSISARRENETEPRWVVYHNLQFRFSPSRTLRLFFIREWSIGLARSSILFSLPFIFSFFFRRNKLRVYIHTRLVFRSGSYYSVCERRGARDHWSRLLRCQRLWQPRQVKDGRSRASIKAPVHDRNRREIRDVSVCPPLNDIHIAIPPTRHAPRTQSFADVATGGKGKRGDRERERETDTFNE